MTTADALTFHHSLSPLLVRPRLECEICRGFARRKYAWSKSAQKRRRSHQISAPSFPSITLSASSDGAASNDQWQTSLFQKNERVGSKYIITGILGQGNNGITYEAKIDGDRSSSLVALKALSFKAMSNWKALELFERESRTLRSLSHPAIPTYIDSFEVDKASDRIFVLVQRKAPGLSLQRLLDEGYRFTTQQITAVFRQLLEVLQYLSSLNPPVLHRDVKPSNVVLNLDEQGDFQLSLVDFGGVNTGIVTGASKVSFGSTMIGTFGYMAPEQFSGATDVRSDLYAAAATILYMLTGCAPSSLPQKRLRIDVESVLPQRERIKLGNVYTVMMKLLEPAPEDRYDTATDALDALLGNPNSNIAEERGGASARTRAFSGLGTSLSPDEALSLEQALASIGTAADNARTGPLEMITGWAGRRLRRRKPVGSRVILDRDRSNRLLRVTIPAKGLSSESLSKGMFAVAWTGFIAFWTAGVLTGGAPVIVSIFSIPFWAAGVKLGQSVLDEVTGLTTLVVSFGGGEKEVFYFGLSNRAAVGRMDVVEGDARDLIQASVEIRMYVNDTPVTELVLQEGTRRHVVGTGLDQIEQEWLRDEINDFLNCRNRR